MATSRVSNSTTLSSSKNDRRQAQARIRALQQRTSVCLTLVVITGEGVAV